jgi:mannosyltransferase OCH1-like enzyme
MKIHQILINDTNKLPKEFPKFHNICVEQIKKLYPDEEYKIYSGEELEAIIKNNFNDDVYTAYKKLKPYACKSDLARLCLLYLYGGLYIDLNIYFINTIPDLEKLEFFAFRDFSERSKQSWAVQNGIMYSLPNSKVLKNSIDLIVNHCKEEYYGIYCVDVSATTVLGRGIVKSLPNFGIATTGSLDIFTIKSLDEKTQNKIKKMGYGNDLMFGFIMDSDYEYKLIAIRKPSEGGDIQSIGFCGTNNYVEMWENGNVYDTSIKFNKKNSFSYYS